MDINSYCRRKLSRAESAAVSGFAQFAERGFQPASALVLRQEGENLILSRIINSENNLSVAGEERLADVGNGSAVKAAANRIIADFERTEGIDLRTDKQALERVEQAVSGAFEKLGESYTAEIFLPFIADVSHLEAHLSRMEADAYMTEAFTKVREKIREAAGAASEIAFILDAPEADEKRLMRILKGLAEGIESRIVTNDGSGQEKEDRWIIEGLDAGVKGSYPVFADHILPSPESLLAGAFADVWQAMEKACGNTENRDLSDTFLYGMTMVRDRLAGVMHKYHVRTEENLTEEGNETIDRTDLPLGLVKTVMKDILASMDDLERGLGSISEEKRAADPELALEWNSFTDIRTLFVNRLERMQITEIDAEGAKFDPKFHDAVIHVENEALGENTVAEVLIKGYMYGNQVLRYSVVKVAN